MTFNNSMKLIRSRSLSIKQPSLWALLFSCLFLSMQVATAQTTAVRGIVRDDATGKGIEGVSVVLPGTPYGAITNSSGFYELQSTQAVSSISFSYLGYETLTRPLLQGQNQRMDVRMKEDSRMINEVVIQAQKGKYRNKDNPAVALIRKVIEHKSANRMGHYQQLQFETYEKLQIALNNPPFTDVPLVTERFDFVFQNIDSGRFDGRNVWPFYLEENLIQQYQTRHPQRHKSIVKAIKRVNFDEKFVNVESAKTFLKHLFQDIDIYDDNVRVMTNEFLSPIADMAPTFYQFFITDTLIATDGSAQVLLSYVPRNKTDKLFKGKLWVTLDGRYAVAAADMLVDQSVNLNWVQELGIWQKFDRMEDGRYLLRESKSYAHFGVAEIKDGIFGERNVVNRNFDWISPISDSVFRSAEVVGDARGRSEEFWAAVRPEPLSQVEVTLYKNVDSLNKMPEYRRSQFWVSGFGSGYFNMGVYEIGPIGPFISFNPVEGLKLRLGGRTRSELNKWLYADGYIAYGFKDQKWKYLISAYLSLNGRNVFTEYPLHYLKFSANRETSIPGLETQFFAENNVLASIKRGENDKWLYNDIYQADYLVEFGNHHQLNLRYSNRRQAAAANLHFVSADVFASDTIGTINNEVLSLNWRWAPGEQFVQRKTYRRVVPSANPIFNIQVGMGFPGFMGGRYKYQYASGDVFKRFYLSQLGIADVRLKGFYLHGQVPFPLLDIARANQTYGFDLNAYNLMNFLEFVSDRNVSLTVDYHLYGFLFNKVPLLKYLKWREVVGFKLLHGGLSRQNDPAYTTAGLLRFPADSLGRMLTYPLNDVPYMELNFGVENVFNLFRVDLVRRLNYLQHPNVSKWGIRVGLQADF